MFKRRSCFQFFQRGRKNLPRSFGGNDGGRRGNGQNVGNVGKIGGFYEEEVTEATKDMATVIEPILMIFIGAAVGFFALSMIKPMYSMMNGI